MNPFFSVIVPVYNVEAYLQECMESVLTSHRVPANYEIILINDGSTDHSGDLCDVYASQYPEIVHTVHQPNEGLSSARNTGIRYASGEYIVLLDSDDKLAPGALDRLAVCVGSDFPDLIVNHVDQFADRTNHYTLFNGNYPEGDRVLDCREEYMKLLKNKKFVTSAWTFTVKRELLQKEKISFYERIYHEDELWTHKICLAAETLKYNDEPFYLYRINRAGSIMSATDLKHLSDKMFILRNILTDAEKLDFAKKELAEAKAAELYWSIVFGAKDFMNTEHKGELISFLSRYMNLLKKSKFSEAKVVNALFFLIGIKNTECALKKWKQ